VEIFRPPAFMFMSSVIFNMKPSRFLTKLNLLPISISILLDSLLLTDSMSEFNVTGSLVQGLRRAYQGSRTFTGTREQFWTDALPGSTT